MFNAVSVWYYQRHIAESSCCIQHLLSLQPQVRELMAVLYIILLVPVLRNTVYGSAYNDDIMDHLPGNYTPNNPCPLATLNRIAKCRSDFLPLAFSGYPWEGISYHGRNHQNLTDSHRLIGDPLDSLNRMCRMFSNFQKCSSCNQIHGYCSLIPHRNVNAPDLNTTFYFLCKMAPRTLDTVHTLQCLKDSKVLSLLQYHIGNHCVHGPGILENQMKVFKKALFYMMDIRTKRHMPPVLIDQLCLPRKVIEVCVKDIIERECGNSTTELVVRYINFRIEQNAKALSDVGLSPVECEWDQISQYMYVHNTSGTSSWSNRPEPVMRYRYGDARADPHRMLPRDAGGTGLNTLFGKILLLDLEKRRPNRCDKNLLFRQYEKCLLFSDARREHPRYSILQSAHQLLNVLTQGTMCSRLEDLVACWNIQKEVCGSATRGFEHDFILQIESCHIQQYMESIQCEWQDMLFDVYIEAAQKTAWPLVSQSGQPLFLPSVYYRIDEVFKSFERFIQLLQPGVNRIASRCGSGAAKKLHTVYRKLRYTMADAFKLKEDILR